MALDPMFGLGGATVLIKNKLAALVVVVLLLSFITILLIALNPRSQSVLLGDRMLTAASNLLNLLEMLLPPLVVDSVNPR